MQNGFLEGLRGKGGGYRLTRSPDQYTVEEILMLTEGSLAPVTCLTRSIPLAAWPTATTIQMWKGLNEPHLQLSHITLADLALPDQAGNDYVIWAPFLFRFLRRTAHCGAPFLHSSSRNVWNSSASITVDGRPTMRYTTTCIPHFFVVHRKERSVTKYIFQFAHWPSVFSARCCAPGACRCRCLPV